MLPDVLVSWGARYTSIDSSFNAILAEDDPCLERVNQVDENFPPSSAVLFALLSPGNAVRRLVEQRGDPAAQCFQRYRRR